MDLSLDTLLQRALMAIPLILSLSVHEYAHALSAWWLGDDTAAREGRLTLNPLAHIDPVGTLLLPLLGVPFGWAKPVPVNPTRFRREVPMARGMMITSVAGPLSNLLLAAAAGLAYALTDRFASDVLVERPALGTLALILVALNVALAVFNMIPLPPLDGSRVVEWLLPYRLRDGWARLSRVAPLLLLGLIVLGAAHGPIRWAQEVAFDFLSLVSSWLA